MNARVTVRKICLAMVGVCLVASSAWSISFGLDDNPSMLPGLWGLGAEDPYAVGRGPLGGLAPSPSLLVPLPPLDGAAFDADILMPGPGIPAFQLLTPNGMFIDALSANTPATDLGIRLDFSVDRLSLGLPGTAVSGQAGLLQQPGDIFTSTAGFISPGAFAGTLGPVGAPVPGLRRVAADGRSWWRERPDSGRVRADTDGVGRSGRTDRSCRSRCGDRSCDAR